MRYINLIQFINIKIIYRSREGTTTTTTTTIMNPMITREYNPFYQLKVEKCEVKDIKGQIIFESYISNTHMCCGDAWVKIIWAVFYFKCFF